MYNKVGITRDPPRKMSMTRVPEHYFIPCQRFRRKCYHRHSYFSTLHCFTAIIPIAVIIRYHAKTHAIFCVSLDCSQSRIFPWDRRCRSLSSTGRHFGFSIRGKLEKRSRKTVCYSEQIMSADKIIAYFRARWTVLFFYITIISRVTGDQISSPDAENKRGEQHTSAGRGRLSP